MLRPALIVLTPPAAALAIQDDELTLPVTSPVVASLSPFLTEDCGNILYWLMTDMIE
jgi:hypothetical protein